MRTAATETVTLIVWMPLVLLAAMQSIALGHDKLSDLLLDFAVHARCRVAVLLFILAQQFTLFTLGTTGRHFGSRLDPRSGPASLL